MKLTEVLPKLTAKLPPEVHRIRKLPGGGQWVFIPWRSLLAYLDQICPEDWAIAFSDPIFLVHEDKRFCVIRCTLTICGVPRQAPGSAEHELISRDGNDMAQGDPIERATADAIRSACELFGIGVYLHQQRDRQWQQKLIAWVRQAQGTA
ncbi:Rad52/Rad22 family DNA repair protein [Pseudanabaena sp. FACHB-2040]|uniref:Rad52/Rad22 family DNA repair protein n=1 Tax=Pseudanabaena sp. FACHB-2040 TaxID=2692859 RepID=UPI0016861C77|nr:Rad52/Rad22 family DNA repair protein [Pseudanabaena sp. FACHB-2040]MBD2261382.1 hypothetical protein [Pseudanabaena sp. FACHB-2040]